MPQRDVARATSAPTAPSVVPGTPDGSSVPPAHPTAGAAPTPTAPRPAASGPAAPGPAAPTQPTSAAPAQPTSAAPAQPAPGTPLPRTPTDRTPAPVPAPPPDARTLARAGLAAGRSPSLWWACAGIVLALAVTFAIGVNEGALVLAAVLAVSAVARAVLHPPPVALTVRSRLLDSVVLAGLALALGLLAPLIPTR